MEQDRLGELSDSNLECAIVSVLLCTTGSQKEMIDRYQIKPEHFHCMPLPRIIELMQGSEEGNVSFYTLSLRIPEHKDLITKLIGLGGAARINFKSIVQSLIDLYKRRLVQEFLRVYGLRMWETEVTASEMLQQMNRDFTEITKNQTLTNMQSSTLVSEQILADLNTIPEISSVGIEVFDRAMGGGLYRGKAYAFAARKKTGKTILAATISSNLNEAGKKHLFIAAEMSSKEIHQRVIARHINKNTIAFISREKGNETFKAQVMGYKDAGNVLYADEAGIKFKRLKEVVSAAIYKHNIEGFILDYFQLVGGSGREGLTSHYDEVAQWIATFCRENNVWALVMAQMNQTDNIRGGEGIRLAFDQVYELKRCGNEEEGYSNNGFWIDQMDTRYTPWCKMGDEKIASLIMEMTGPHFRDNNYNQFHNEY